MINRKTGTHQEVTLYFVMIQGENILDLYKLKRAPETWGTGLV